MGVEVQGDKEVGAAGIGDGGSLFQGKKDILVTGEDNLASQFLFQLFGQSFGYLEDDILLLQAKGAGAGVLAAMTGIKDNAADAKV